MGTTIVVFTQTDHDPSSEVMKDIPTMNITESSAVLATLNWVGFDGFIAPWLKYNPTLQVGEIPELNMKDACWDIVVRQIKSLTPDELQAEVVFQFASRRAPHDLLQVGLEFYLCEGPGKAVWRGVIKNRWLAPRDPNYWWGAPNSFEDVG